MPLIWNNKFFLFVDENYNYNRNEYIKARNIYIEFQPNIVSHLYRRYLNKNGTFH